MLMKIGIPHIFFFLVCTFLSAQESIVLIGQLPSEVSETSGLLFHNGRLITHNDSGNTPELFEIDTVSMQIVRKVAINNAENVDWEDIAQDDSFIYIGDFGNNKGIRQDLGVYRISKQEFVQSNRVDAEWIGFTYADQMNFEDNGNSDWDAEALFVLDDQLIVLTKRWVSGGTIAYTLPKTIGTHTANRVGEYSINGMVTGATYSSEAASLLVIGYSSLLEPFALKVEGGIPNNIFDGNVEEIELGIGFAQIEGVTYIDENRYFISSERFINNNLGIALDPLLFALQLSNGEEDEISPPEIVEPSPEPTGQVLVISRPFDSNMLVYSLTSEKPVLARAIFDSSGRMVQRRVGKEIENNTIDLSFFKSAVYYLTLYLGDEIISEPFISN